MKAILLSIRPQHVANILNGLKTIEIRKHFPRDYVGWVYIYCTKQQGLARLNNDTFIAEKEITKDNFKQMYSGYDGKGKVVARFWVDKIDLYDYYQVDEELSALTCVPLSQLEIYVGSGLARAIHITKLEIFDKPKELWEFGYYNTLSETGSIKSITRAPQNYCFIEV